MPADFFHLYPRAHSSLLDFVILFVGLVMFVLVNGLHLLSQGLFAIIHTQIITKPVGYLSQLAPD